MSLKVPRAIGAFQSPSFSVFFAGQVASNVGTWFQNLALALVILEATGSAQSLSWVTIAQFTPMLLLSLPAGRVADRYNPRVILMITSLASSVVVGLIAILLTDVTANLVLVYGLIGLLGCASAFERIAAQTLVNRLADDQNLGSVVATYSIALAAARAIGPGLAGLMLSAAGGPACLAVNALSYLAVFGSLFFVRVPDRLATHPGQRKTPLIALVRTNRWFFTIVLTTMIIALLSLNLLIVITSFVSISFGGDATAVGMAHAINAVGSITGGFIAAGMKDMGPRSLTLGCVVFGSGLLMLSFAPTLAMAIVFAAVLGAAHGYYLGVVNAAAQGSVPRQVVGRAMSVLTLAQYGLTPIGGLLAGTVIDLASPAVMLQIGGTAAIVAGLLVWSLMAGRTPEKPSAGGGDGDA